MQLHQSDAAHKSPPGFPPERPEPSRLTMQYDCGVSLELPWEGWAAVLGWMHERHVVGLRVGDRVILTPLHWTQVLWGRA